MGRNLLEISIIVLSLLVASTAPAAEVIVNGGFETGDLAPWEKIGQGNTWTVTDEYALEGTHSGFVQGAYQIAQSFTPRPGSSIEVFSVAVMTAMPAWVRVEVDYADGLGPTWADRYVSTAFQWQTLELLDCIDPDRVVQRVVLAGHGDGDSPYHTRTWVDAVTLRNNTPEEPPVVEETEVIQAETKNLRVRFNLKKPRTHFSLALQADELPEGIHEGPVEIRVQLTQEGFTTEFDSVAELVEVPQKCKNIIRLMDVESAQKVKPKK